MMVNVKDHGAVGDGITNDTTAFRVAAEAINAANGGTLFIPPGNYVVGRQSLIGGQYQGEDIIYIHDCTGLVTIQGSGATLKASDGLKVGYFDGEKALAYWGMIRLEDNTMVAIRDLELDGNILNIELGERHPDNGTRETPAYGIYAYRNQNVLIESLYTHHHALDGVVIGYDGLEETDAATPHTLINVVSEYNARQALSWVGGIGVTAINCKFNHTGQAIHTNTTTGQEQAVNTSPSAGLDIEPEASVCRQGNFIGCEFINNKGSSVAAGYPEGGDTTFKKCLFWGTEYYTLFLRSAPRLVFEDCTIYGSCIAGSTSGAFIRCHFEDRDHPSYGVYRRGHLIGLESDQLVMDNCVVVANQLQAIFADGAVTKYIRNTTITHRYDGLKDESFQSLFRHCVFENVLFKEDMIKPRQTSWYIGIENVQFSNLFVQGPYVKWANWSWGITGQIGSSEVASQPKLLINNDQRPAGPFVGQKSIVVLDAVPSSESWQKGDIVLSQIPEAGGNIGWVCIEEGTPGTWRPFGKIDN